MIQISWEGIWLLIVGAVAVGLVIFEGRGFSSLPDEECSDDAEAG